MLLERKADGVNRILFMPAESHPYTSSADGAM